MKYLLVVVVVVGVLWLMLGRRRVGQPAPPAQPVKRPQALLACAHCGLQLPAGDAVLDGSRVYCCEAHRAQGPGCDAADGAEGRAAPGPGQGR